MTNRRAHIILLTIALAVLCLNVYSQTPTSVRLRGTIDQCRAVQVLDRELPVDSLRVTPALTAQTQKAILLCMTSAFPVGDDTTSIAIPGDVGRLLPITILRSDSTLTLIEPADLDTLYLTSTYQLVTPSVADTIIVDSILTTRPWNGSSGGVIILDAHAALSLNGIIDASGLGYGGGPRSEDGGTCGVTQACDPPRSTRTGGKGASPLRPDPACASGHRPWASGGGGGDAHNAGGGGGANGGRGGRGGDQYRCSEFIGMSGVGGLRLTDASSRRVFLGGGGGGGHQNNSLATNGAAGGGIIVLRAPRIIGDSVRLLARGADVSTAAGNDGAGGGGGGGTVRIEACSSSCLIRIDASGGRGGTTVSGHGPGGGGGGGRTLLNPALVQDDRHLRITLSGGAAGTITNQPTNPNGAADGQAGQLLTICDDIIAHDVTVPGWTNVGDTLRIDIAARDTTSLCECLISHYVQLRGPSAAPLTSGIQLQGLALIATSEGSDDITYEIRIPSRYSISIPFQCVLSPDTAITALIRTRVESSLGVTLCVVGDDTSTISFDVCGLSRRQVAVGAPFRMSARTTSAIGASRELVCDIESAAAIGVDIRVYDAIGSLMFEQPMPLTSSHQRSSGSLRLDAAAWPPGIYFVVALTTHGTRSTMIRL